MAYAENTNVPVEKSKAEIERLLQRYGANQFVSGWDEKRAFVAFRMFGRQIKFVITLPERSDRQFTHTDGRGLRRTEAKVYEAWEQACRQRWRALALVIKAKLEAVETGITVFEDEFMAHIVLPDGQTVGEFMRPQIVLAYEKGCMPKLLPYAE
jgi:hypothetical protein